MKQRRGFRYGEVEGIGEVLSHGVSEPLLLAQGYNANFFTLKSYLNIILYGLNHHLLFSSDDLRKRKVHVTNKSGIAGCQYGAESVVLSGEYEDDIDEGDTVYVHHFSIVLLTSIDAMTTYRIGIILAQEGVKQGKVEFWYAVDQYSPYPLTSNCFSCSLLVVRREIREEVIHTISGFAYVSRHDHTGFLFE